MKLSSETLSILKNFGNINQGLFFKKGKTLKTVNSHKNVLAEVVIEEEIPSDFGIYDLNNLLSVMTLHKDDPLLEFDDKHVIIVGNRGRSKIKYRCCDSTMIVTPPEQSLVIPDPEITFELSNDDFEWILKSANVLSSPHIAVESDGKKINLVALNTQDDSTHVNSFEVGEGNGSKYQIIFKTENLSKILSGSYDVKISSKGISNFVNKNIPLQYWIATETGSKFG